MKKEKDTPKKVLPDHSQVGKKLIPPMLQIPNLQFIQWSKNIIPELLWIGLLNEKFGLETGTNLAVSLAEEATKANTNKGKKIWFAKTSSFSLLDNRQKLQITDNLHDKLTYLQEGLLVFTLFYPECPLNFLYKKENIKKSNKQQELTNLKITLSKIFSRREPPATFVQATAFYIGLVSRIIHIVKDVNVPLENFPEIVNYPKTEESKKIASFVRASINSFFGPPTYEKIPPWPTYFWNRGLEITPCEVD